MYWETFVDFFYHLSLGEKESRLFTVLNNKRRELGHQYFLAVTGKYKQDARTPVVESLQSMENPCVPDVAASHSVPKTDGFPSYCSAQDELAISIETASEAFIAALPTGEVDIYAASRNRSVRRAATSRGRLKHLCHLEAEYTDLTSEAELPTPRRRRNRRRERHDKTVWHSEELVQEKAPKHSTRDSFSRNSIVSKASLASFTKYDLNYLHPSLDYTHFV